MLLVLTNGYCFLIHDGYEIDTRTMGIDNIPIQIEPRTLTGGGREWRVRKVVIKFKLYVITISQTVGTWFGILIDGGSIHWIQACWEENNTNMNRFPNLNRA